MAADTDLVIVEEEDEEVMIEETFWLVMLAGATTGKKESFLFSGMERDKTPACL
jgi:hypothetical protein